MTWFEVEEILGERALLEVRLETGRTHQIRVHLEAIGLPVCGDPVYGVAGDLGLERQFLHAHRLVFDHPFTGSESTSSRRSPGTSRMRSREHGTRPSAPRRVAPATIPRFRPAYPATPPGRGCRRFLPGSVRARRCTDTNRKDPSWQSSP